MKTIIHSNGSKWLGQSPDTIDQLLKVLENNTIEERFFKYFTKSGKNGLDYYQHCPISMRDGMTWFFGNFEEISHVFRIETNDTKVIEKLSKSIKNNKGWLQYRDKNKSPVKVVN